MQKTPWFAADVMPVRDGEYEVKRLIWDFGRKRFHLSRHRLEFFRGKWYYTERARMSYPGSLAAMTHDNQCKWRGLANDPSDFNGGRNMEVDRHEDDTDNWW